MEVFYRAGNLDLLVGPKPSKLRLDIEEALKSAESEDSLEAKAEKFSESLIGFFKEAKVDQINDLVSTLWNILIQKAIAPDYDDDQKLIASTFQTIRNKHGASDLNLDVYFWGNKPKAESFIARVWNHLKPNESSEPSKPGARPSSQTGSEPGGSSRRSSYEESDSGESSIQGSQEDTGPGESSTQSSQTTSRPGESSTAIEKKPDGDWMKWQRLNMFMIKLANSGCDTLCFLGTLEIRHALECGYTQLQWLERRLWAATQWFIQSHDTIYAYVANEANADMPTCGELARAIDRCGQKRWDFWKLQLRILQKKSRKRKYWQGPQTEELVDAAVLAESRAWMDRESDAVAPIGIAPIDIPRR